MPWRYWLLVATTYHNGSSACTLGSHGTSSVYIKGKFATNSRFLASLEASLCDFIDLLLFLCCESGTGKVDAAFFFPRFLPALTCFRYMFTITHSCSNRNFFRSNVPLKVQFQSLNFSLRNPERLPSHHSGF